MNNFISGLFCTPRIVQNVILRHGVAQHAEFLVDNATTYDARLPDRTGEEFQFSSHFKSEDPEITNDTFLHHAKIMRNGRYDVAVLQSKRWNRTAVQ